jgi:hypothetical protein
MDIEKSHALSTGELLQRSGRIYTRYQFGGGDLLMRGPRGGYCTPTVYLDGIRMFGVDTHSESSRKWAQPLQ